MPAPPHDSSIVPQLDWGERFRWFSIDGAMGGLLALTLGYAAFAFGGVEGSAQFVLSLMVSLLVLLLAWRLVTEPGFHLAPTWMWVPCGLLLLLAIFQLVPLPRSVVEVLAPARVAQYEPVLAGDAVPEHLPLSSAPAATRHALRLAILASAVLMVVTSCVRTRRDIELMVLAVFGLGCLEAMLAVAQIATGAERLYGLFDPGPRGMMTAGSFVNHSHFSQLVNLAIGAGAALLMMRLHSAERSGRHARGVWGQGWILAGLALCAFAVCLSLSRSGILSLALATGLAGCGLAMQKRAGSTGWTLLAVPLGAFALLLPLGLEGFYARLATLGQAGSYEDRWALTSASLEAGADYPLLGTGLGTYPDVFPAYDTTGSASVAAYADNDYAQLFVEGGITGVAILLVFAFLVCRALCKSLKCHQASTAQVAWGLMIGLIAIAVQSVTDFGQRLPGVFLTTITLAGILSVLPNAIRHDLGENVATPARTGRRRAVNGGVRWVGIVTMVMAMTWVVEGAYAHRQAEVWWGAALRWETELRAKGWQGTDDDYAALLVAAENRVAWEPDDARARFQLNSYRWQSVSRSARIDSGALAEVDRQIVEQIVDQLARIRRSAPCFAATYLLEGQLRTYVLKDVQNGGQLIARAAELDVGNPQVQFHYGEWCAHFGSAELARQQLHRAVAIDGRRHFAPAARLAIDVLDDVPTAIAWAGDDLDRLDTVASMLEETPKHAELLADVRDRMARVEVQLADRGEASPALLLQLGDRASNTGDHDAAVAYYRQALSQQFQSTRARLGLAHSLRAQGHYDDAMKEVKTCLRHEPHNAQARHLAETLALEVSATAGE